MKKSAKLTLTILCAAVFLCSAACAVLYFFAARTAFDTDILHFADAPIVTAMTAMLIVTPVLCAAAGFSVRRKASVTAQPPHTPLTAFASLLTALLFAASAAVTYMSVSSAPFIKANALTTVTAILAALSCVYFILFYGGEKTANVRIWLSFAPVAWGLCHLLSIYFDQTRTINDPIKSLQLLLCAAILLFLCEDIRFYIGIQNVAIYYFVSLGAVYCTVAIAIPNLILSMMKTPTFGFAPIECALYISFGFFALARMASLPRVLGEYTPPVHPNDKNAEKKESAEGESAESEAVADKPEDDTTPEEAKAEGEAKKDDPADEASEDTENSTDE